MGAYPVVTIHAHQLQTPDSLVATPDLRALGGRSLPPPRRLAPPRSSSFSFAARYRAFVERAPTLHSMRRARASAERLPVAAPPPCVLDQASTTVEGKADLPTTGADPFPTRPEGQSAADVQGRVASFFAATAQKADDPEKATAAPAAYAAAVGGAEGAAAAAAHGVFVDGLDYSDMMRI